MNSDFVLRKDAIPKLYDADVDSFLDSYNIIEENYPYILESMKEEFFLLENPRCHLFKELLYEEKVVGFVSYDLENGFGEFALNEIYVLPNFRGNSYFYDELLSLLHTSSSISIIEPNHLIIDLLVKYGFAVYLNDYLVASGIELDVPPESYTCNNKEISLELDTIYSSNLYDTNISATILLDDISTKDKNIIYYSRLLDSDEKDYDARKQREQINQEYFENIKIDMLINQEDFITSILALKEKSESRLFEVKELVGHEDELSNMLQSLVDDNILSLERAYQIQEQIIREYENNEVLQESLVTRLIYLCEEKSLEKDLELEQLLESNDEKCPYCKMPIELPDYSCRICGYNLSIKKK